MSTNKRIDFDNRHIAKLIPNRYKIAPPWTSTNIPCPKKAGSFYLIKTGLSAKKKCTWRQAFLWTLFYRSRDHRFCPNMMNNLWVTTVCLVLNHISKLPNQKMPTKKPVLRSTAMSPAIIILPLQWKSNQLMCVCLSWSNINRSVNQTQEESASLLSLLKGKKEKQLASVATTVEQRLSAIKKSFSTFSRTSSQKNRYHHNRKMKVTWERP